MKTKKHFDILDGLRGVAALSVVIFHYMEVVIPDYSQDFIGHGFLAVDFFFCLSGFVIAYAYDDRMKKLGIRSFFKARLIRLHPLVILGSILGLSGFLFDPFTHADLSNLLRIAAIFLCSLLVIPFPAMTERAFNLFSFNAPAWSLFWEYIANLFYAYILCRIRRRYLILLMFLAAIAIIVVVYREGSLLGGWSGPTFWDGFVRVSWSFMAGMLIYRSGWIVNNRLGFLSMSVLLVAAFFFPFSKWNLLWESLIVLVWFPLIVALGAGTAAGSRLKRLCEFSGKISYPLYMTHYWVIWIFAGYYEKHHPTGAQLLSIIAAGVIFQLALAWLAMIAFDNPVRRKLAGRPS
jgi:peptidoglycan/LPS O-acetylase OafA/YrhL